MSRATKFVVVEMPVEKSNSELISFLEDNDYTTVFCMRSLTAHQTVQKHIQDQLGKKECEKCKPHELPSVEQTPVMPTGHIVTENESKPTASAVKCETVEIKPERMQDSVEYASSEPDPIEEFLHPDTEPSHRSHADITKDVDNIKNIKTESGIENNVSTNYATSTTKNTIILKRRANRPTVLADVATTNIVVPTMDSENSEEPTQPEPILTNDQECVEDLAGDVATAHTPLVIWLKRKKGKQSTEDQNRETKSKENESPMSKIDKSGDKKDIVDGSVKCKIVKKLDAADSIYIDNNDLQNSMTLQEELLQTDNMSFENPESEDRTTNPSPSTNLRKRKTSSRSDVPQIPMKDPTNETTKKSNKRNSGASQPKIRKVNADSINADDSVKCTVCLKDVTHSRRGALLEHAKRHSDIKQFHCSAEGCDYSGTATKEVVRHMKFKHKIIAAAKDTLNDELKNSWVESFERCYPTQEAELAALKQRASMRGLVQDLTTSSEGEKFEKCTICSKFVAKKLGTNSELGSLLAHAKSHADIKQFHCTVEGCDYAGVIRSYATDHMKITHDIMGTPKNMMSNELRNSWLASLERCFPKVNIDESLKTTKQMRKKLCDPQSLNDTEKCMVCSNILSTTKTIHGKTKHCASSLNEHAKYHCDRKQYSCPVEGCGYSNSFTDTVAAHIKKEHRIVDKPLNAAAELKEAWQASLKLCFPIYTQHMENKLKSKLENYGDAPIKCMVCQKDVNQRLPGLKKISSLLQHAKFHADMKQFHCIADGCNYAVVAVTKVDKHMKSKHNILGKAKNMFSKELKKSWAESFVRCYPTLEAELTELKGLKQMTGIFPDVHKSNVETCMICSQEISRAVKGKTVALSLLPHAQSHADMKQFHCTVPGCDFSNIRTGPVGIHMKSAHNSEETPKNTYSKELRKSWLVSFQRCYPTLKFEFACLNLMRHKSKIAVDRASSKNTEKCMICSKNILIKRLQAGKIMTSRANLFEHSKSHCSKRQYSCPVNGCGFSNSSSTRVVVHVKQEHDIDDTPINAYEELKEKWRKLFKLCFPSQSQNWSRNMGRK